MATFDEVKALADRTYIMIWQGWYRDTPAAKPAHHDFQISDYSAGYSPSTDCLLNPIGEGNLDDPDILDQDQWPIWKVQLVHEMLHEYQKKAITAPTSQGISLHGRFANSFAGDGHDQTFFTAIAEKAAYFAMTPEELISRI